MLGERRMKITEILEQMEKVLLDSSRLPLTNKRIVEEDDMLQLIDELHDALPAALMEAERIIAERQHIMAEAQTSAQDIVDQAKSYVMKLTEEHLITRQAQEQADEIIGSARQTAAELRSDATQYAHDVFQYLEGQLEKTIEVVRQGRDGLQSDDKEKNQ